MTIPFKKLKDVWMKSPSFRAEYDRLALAFALIKARAKAGMTQAEARRRRAPTQSIVARIGRGKNHPISKRWSDMPKRSAAASK